MEPTPETKEEVVVKEEVAAVLSTAYMDVKGDDIKSDNLVLYNDPDHGVNGDAGYIVKNLLGVWEVRNVSEQTGTDLAKTSRLEVIGITRK